MGIWTHLLGAFTLRLMLCAYAEFHDSYFDVKYTDVDYHVFTDAAQHLADGGSPYDRETYRYSPLVAYIMLPNIIYHPICGKVILCLFDVIAGLLIYKMVSDDRPKNRKQDMYSLGTWAAQVWLWNPFTMAISSRGSFEPIQCCLVHLALFFGLRRRYLLCGLIWGFSVHMKMYTVIYGLCFYMWANYYNRESGLWDMLKPNFSRVIFCFGSMIGFGGPTAYFYLEYGHTFLHETFLYHLGRVDTQHNFSPVFYPMRLLSEDPTPDNQLYMNLIGIGCFILQALMVTRAAFRYSASHLPFALFTQTCWFVLLNKVCTSQYFTWYLCLLPLVVHKLPLRKITWAVMFLAWLGAQGQWLFQAYYFEFENADNLFEVFVASGIYFLSHVLLLMTLTYKYDKYALTDAVNKEL